MKSSEVIQVFSSFQNPQNARSMEAYMKNKFDFIGIKSPQRKEISREVMAEAKKEATFDSGFFRELWEAPQREMQYVAQEYLFYTRKWWPVSVMEDIHYALTHKSWWDTVDFLASSVVGYLYISSPSKYFPTLKEWVTNSDIWLRRTSIIFQLKYKNEVDTEFLQYAIEKNLGSQEFFINKAIGWSLRQYSKYNPEWVETFIHTHELSNLSRREAIKYLK